MLRQFSRGANVIEVTMRQQDLHQRDASLRHHRFDTFSIAAGIDQRRQPGLPAPDKRTVLRERGNRNNTIVHDAPFVTSALRDRYQYAQSYYVGNILHHLRA